MSDKARGREAMPQPGALQGYDPAALMCKCQHPISNPSPAQSCVLSESLTSPLHSALYGMYGLSSGYPPGFPGLPQTPPINFSNATDDGYVGGGCFTSSFIELVGHG